MHTPPTHTYARTTLLSTYPDTHTPLNKTHTLTHPWKNTHVKMHAHTSLNEVSLTNGGSASNHQQLLGLVAIGGVVVPHHVAPLILYFEHQALRARPWLARSIQVRAAYNIISKDSN